VELLQGEETPGAMTLKASRRGGLAVLLATLPGMVFGQVMTRRLGSASRPRWRTGSSWMCWCSISKSIPRAGTCPRGGSTSSQRRRRSRAQPRDGQATALLGASAAHFVPRAQEPPCPQPTFWTSR
jgi:hypothetical protein